MSFAFIESDFKVDFPLPVKLSERFTLANATAEQLQEIKERLAMIGQFVSAPCDTYEYDWTVTKTVDGTNESSSTSVPIPLPPSEWRYRVVFFDGDNNQSLLELESAFCLLKQGIHIGFVSFNFGVMHHDEFAFRFYSDYRRIHAWPRNLTQGDVAAVRKYFQLITEVGFDAPVITALRSFHDLRGLNPNSPHQVLACFAILEALLTHEPNVKDIGEPSLTHQLKTKLVLVERIFERPLDYSTFVPKNEGEDKAKWKRKIWADLYSYRSCIAHGNRFDFSKDFKRFGTPEKALTFLREVTKLTLILALEQPQFIEDLKTV